MIKTLTKLKIFLEPISYTKWRWWIYFSTEVFDAFQSIFTIQIGAFIIAAIERKDIVTIKFRCGILWTIFLLNYIIGRIGQMAQEVSNGWTELWLKRKFFEQYIHLENTKVEAIGTGKMQNIIFEWINNRRSILNETIPAIIVEIGAIIYAFVLVANQVPSWEYFIGFLWLFIIAGTLIWIWLSILKNTGKKAKEINLEIARRDVKIIMSKFEILQNNKLWEEINKQETLIYKKIRLRQRGNTIKELWQTSSGLIIDGMRIGIYMMIGIGIITEQYTFAYMVLLLQLLGTISRYIWNIRKYLKEYYKSIVHIEKLRNTFETIPIMENDSDKKKFIYKKWNFTLKNISFSYQKNNIFQNFSLNISWGTKTAFVGESWWGKTTLIKLLAGYIRPDKGNIRVDGQKLSSIKLTDYYKHIGYLTQDPSVFDGTIHENLIYALDIEPKKETIEKVIQDAKCEFIWEFDHGLETEIWERWVRLSWGQKQRLAIAKIMLKNPNIILLDEPTSALDSFNEELINIALHNLFKGKTVFVVAHRLQTVKQADRILLFEQGKLIEDGTHNQLVKLNGQYKKMLDLQSWF